MTAPGNQPAAEHPVEFVHAGGQESRGGGVDVGDPAGRLEHGGGRRRAGDGAAGLLNAAPRLALAAAAHPFGRGPAALGAFVAGRFGTREVLVAIATQR